eukprot:gb/GECG01004000.1/.p1 GENE.gb/GECG01004000.1/~~gb/GECG01004000.1/.p1  ORF type:complete len:179 (+),score=20.44 gb/GECG01004000.1/:1-537(+)
MYDMIWRFRSLSKGDFYFIYDDDVQGELWATTLCSQDAAANPEAQEEYALEESEDRVKCNADILSQSSQVYHYSLCVRFDETFRVPTLYFRIADASGRPLDKASVEQHLSECAVACGLIEESAKSTSWWRWNNCAIEVRFRASSACHALLTSVWRKRRNTHGWATPGGISTIALPMSG